ncbi:hypothetical protein RHGRI_024620 [Rhododendron griersonianum]|uniref:Uncharacterized protein n=1 Tax=Rhododendron griersonianum TaxID=479676 RepID=A0AAV6JA56_9ERIC|nr:hypothetical protein RHGRI_024620 [Rhododendron griersonianum]
MGAKTSKNWPLMLAAMAVFVFVLAPARVESAFAIEMDTCTGPACDAECKKILQEKYLSAACATPKGSTKKLCICLG